MSRKHKYNYNFDTIYYDASESNFLILGEHCPRPPKSDFSYILVPTILYYYVCVYYITQYNTMIKVGGEKVFLQRQRRHQISWYTFSRWRVFSILSRNIQVLYNFSRWVKKRTRTQQYIYIRNKNIVLDYSPLNIEYQNLTSEWVVGGGGAWCGGGGNSIVGRVLWYVQMCVISEFREQYTRSHMAHRYSSCLDACLSATCLFKLAFEQSTLPQAKHGNTFFSPVRKKKKKHRLFVILGIEIYHHNNNIIQ